MRSTRTTVRHDLWVDQMRIYRLENRFLRVDIAPEIGGRIISIYNRVLEKEFLWRNKGLSLSRAQPGEAYDPHFYGGIDEIIPGDIPERIGSLDCPDHGELWTLVLETNIKGETLELKGMLPRWELLYTKRISLRGTGAWIDQEYRIENLSPERRVFLWKLHAALVIDPGGSLVCPAKTAAVADNEWSRWKTNEPFPWPFVQGKRADLIPAVDGTTDFLFLYDLAEGRVAYQQPGSGHTFSIYFDRNVFPYVCYFASYGGFYQHYTAILEPCTAMPVSVNEATNLNQCSFLEPGGQLITQVSIYAGSAQEEKSC